MQKLSPVLTGLRRSFFDSYLESLGHPGLKTDSCVADLLASPLPSTDCNVDEFRDRYWLSESLSKFPFDLPGIDREAAAYSKFHVAEEQCRASNEAWTGWASRVSMPHRTLEQARRLVAAVLGEFSWDLAIPYCGFGPGASTSLPRSKADHSNKWEFGAHITEQCLPYFLAFRKITDFGPDKILVTAGNKVTTVPKNAKTDRVIAIEPDWNMFFQKGIGGLIRHRLRKRLGLLRNTAQETNKSLAAQGSRDGTLATIDLSAASDSISLAMVAALLPADWLKAVLRTRSRCGEVNGELITYEKVSSMGNGFTFELETLLFWALARAAVGREGTVVVYGDDIIVPTVAAPEVISVLQAAGFEINLSKSFISGPFRESCGGHYHSGIEVTPPYFRKELMAQGDVHTYANQLLIAAHQSYHGEFCDPRFRTSHSLLAEHCKYWGPLELGDSVAWGSVSQAMERNTVRFSKRYQCRAVSGFAAISPRSKKYYGPLRHKHMGAVYASLWPNKPVESSHKKVRPSTRVVRTLVHSWTAPAPWF